MTPNNFYSIGYGNRQFADFMSLLFQYNIHTVVDIRSSPFSRFQPHYNRTSLENELPRHGIQYLYQGEHLGGKPKAEMFYHRSGALNHDLISITKAYQNAIDDVLHLATGNSNISFLCSELNPNSCHRKTLVGETFFKRGIVVNHINEKGGISKHQQNNPFQTLF